jgi:hypothetical protein
MYSYLLAAHTCGGQSRALAVIGNHVDGAQLLSVLILFWLFVKKKKKLMAT